MANTDLVVLTPLVVAHTPDGDVYVPQGGVLPANTDPQQRDMLVDEKQVGSRESAEAEAAKSGPFVPDSLLAAQADATGVNPADADSSSGDSSSSDSGSADDGKPGARAGHPELVAYAVKQGMPEADAKALTKAELREKYGL